MTFGQILIEETRSNLRGRFTLVGTSILLTLLAILAATAGTGNRPEEFLAPAFVVVPTLLIPITAVSVARPRAAHFFEGVFTAPVTETTFLFAKLGSNIILGVGLVAALVPVLVVETAHLGFQAQHWLYVVFALCAVVYSCSLGLLLGILFTGRSIVPTLTVATTVMLATVMGYVLLRPVHVMPPGVFRDAVLALLHLSGLVLLHDILPVGVLEAQNPLPAAAALIVQVAAFIVGAWFVFTHAQSVERWEFGAARVLLLVTVVLSVLTPGTLARPHYEETRERAYEEGSEFTNLTARLSDVSTNPPAPDLFPERPVLSAGTRNVRTLWLFLPGGHAQEARITNVQAELAGEHLEVHPADFQLESPGLLPRAATRPGAPMQPYIAIPLTLDAPPPATLRENQHALRIRLTYEVDGDSFTGVGTMAILSEVDHVGKEVGLVAGTFPFLGFAGFALRRWRMR